MGGAWEFMSVFLLEIVSACDVCVVRVCVREIEIMRVFVAQK